MSNNIFINIPQALIPYRKKQHCKDGEFEGQRFNIVLP
jgi:hypothetical protein